MKKKLVAKILSVALVGVMALGLVACGNDEPATNNGSASNEAESDITVGIVVKTATNAHFQDIAYGAALAGKDLGVEVLIDNTATEADIEGQITKCEDMITKGVDALILTANDSKGVATAVEAAHDNDVKFVTVDTEIMNVWGDDVVEYMPNYIGVDHTLMAYEMAKQIFDSIGGEGNVIILRGVDAASSSQERTAGFEKAIAEYPNITLVESQSANFDQETAQTTMGDILQAQKDVDVVLCCNDLMAVGAVNALKENNFTVGGEDGVIVAGIDGNVIALESIAAGEIYASAYDWSILQGYYAVQQAVALVKGEEVPAETWTPDTIITADNVAEFLPHGQELAQWTMGSKLTDVSDDMYAFLQKGIDMGVKNSRE